jgi:SPW repeat-containing protein
MIRRPALRAPREPLAAAATAVVLLVTVSPWPLGFSGSHAAVAEHIAFAMGIGPIAVLISALPAAAASIALAGGWLLASPWVLGYASVGVGAWSADLLGGVALLALSAAALRAAQPPRPYDATPTTEAGRP